MIIALALFLSLFVMGPTIDQINEKALQPYQADEISFEEAVAEAKTPLKQFMIKQISGSNSRKEISTFYKLALDQKPVMCKVSESTRRPARRRPASSLRSSSTSWGEKAPNALPLR